MINPAESIDSIPLKTDYSRYFLDKDGTMKIKSGLRNRCNRLWRTTVVNTDGYVLPCCFDKEGKYIMGDLRKNKFSEIWKSQTYHEFRKGILKNRKGMELCNNCTEGVKVFM
jgi:radical SAM protein with 4Fe4S-binding SPASM domain